MVESTNHFLPVEHYVLYDMFLVFLLAYRHDFHIFQYENQDTCPKIPVLENAVDVVPKNLHEEKTDDRLHSLRFLPTYRKPFQLRKSSHEFPLVS